ncbi:14824_t:CDS:1, partial [Funneliformis caledonium]
FRFNTIPIGNEASKSQYVCAYLVAVANLLKFKVRPEKNVSGPNGHGPVDFAFVSIQTSKVVGITEVKDKDFLQGVAQNAVQCESALSNNNKRIFGIITDSEKWFFLECSLDNEGKPKFKLSKPMVVVYGDEDMEDRVKKVLGHIAWLLEEAQGLDEPKDENPKD